MGGAPPNRSALGRHVVIRAPVFQFGRQRYSIAAMSRAPNVCSPLLGVRLPALICSCESSRAASIPLSLDSHAISFPAQTQKVGKARSLGRWGTKASNCPPDQGSGACYLGLSNPPGLSARHFSSLASVRALTLPVPYASSRIGK